MPDRRATKLIRMTDDQLAQITRRYHETWDQHRLPSMHAWLLRMLLNPDNRP